MQEGTCKLCLKTAILQDSHYVPRGMYKRIRDGKRKNPNPIIITRKITSSTSRQPTDYVFCAECEQRFNQGGETWIMNSVAHGRRFPLLERLEVAVPEHTLSEAVTYSGRATGIDTGKLGYFALSMVWRGAVHEWPLPFGGKSVQLDLGSMEEPIRQYLMGESPFPQDAAVLVHVCDDRISQESILEPGKRADNDTSYEFLTLGVHFFVFLGQAVTPDIRNMCCVTSNDKVVFRRNCRDRLMQHYGDLARASKRSRMVESEWPD
ncbi:MAG: hypothetical protein WBL65_21810 [Bryobacteraceae bacterium]